MGLAVATALPLFVGGPAAADSTTPEWPVIGDIATGSAAGDAIGTGSAAADSGSSSYGGVLDLEPTGVATGSSAAARSGNARRDGTGSIENGVDDPPADATAGAGQSLGLDPGSVQSACTGSAVIGSATILLGLATGSGVTGSGITGSGLIGTGSVGSSGSGLGSVVVGSAMTGSALLTCLLLLPAPEPAAPGIPLQLGPPPPAPPIPAPPAPAPEFTPVASALAIAPETPTRTTPHRPPIAAAESAPEQQIAWNLLELVTVMVVTVLTVVRKVAVGRNRRAE
ncbi:hypothetical protein [Nocardia anaemiae]|uniref:hypothetical protein n=1 Tax=Nocardia anaemiae TaxID=263910 RepID=UPI0007A55E76|nr:hypothetical protein [Nocardia anaemiae]